MIKGDLVAKINEFLDLGQFDRPGAVQGQGMAQQRTSAIGMLLD
jgi:hypothetical protein